MKITYVFYNGFDDALIFKPSIITKHEANITKQDIEQDVKSICKEHTELAVCEYKGALKGIVRPFNAPEEFTL